MPDIFFRHTGCRQNQRRSNGSDVACIAPCVAMVAMRCSHSQPIDFQPLDVLAGHVSLSSVTRGQNMAATAAATTATQTATTAAADSMMDGEDKTEED
jgi:hypothetical protein